MTTATHGLSIQKSSLKTVMCCGEVYEDQSQYDLGNDCAEDRSAQKTRFYRVKHLIDNLAGKIPSRMVSEGAGLVTKAVFPFLIRVMAYNNLNRSGEGTRWFATYKLSRDGDKVYAEIAPHKIPKLKVGLAGIIDGCNYYCEKHPNTWYRITYCEFIGEAAACEGRTGDKVFGSRVSETVGQPNTNLTQVAMTNHSVPAEKNDISKDGGKTDFTSKIARDPVKKATLSKRDIGNENRTRTNPTPSTKKQTSKKNAQIKVAETPSKSNSSFKDVTKEITHEPKKPAVKKTSKSTPSTPLEDMFHQNNPRDNMYQGTDRPKNMKKTGECFAPAKSVSPDEANTSFASGAVLDKNMAPMRPSQASDLGKQLDGGGDDVRNIAAARISAKRTRSATFSRTSGNEIGTCAKTAQSMPISTTMPLVAPDLLLPVRHTRLSINASQSINVNATPQAVQSPSRKVAVPASIPAKRTRQSPIVEKGKETDIVSQAKKAVVEKGVHESPASPPAKRTRSSGAIELVSVSTPPVAKEPTSSPGSMPARPHLPPPDIPNKSPNPTEEEAALVPDIPLTPHIGLEPGVAQIKWEDQKRATWIWGKLYFPCTRQSNKGRTVWKPWNKFRVITKTGELYAQCQDCRREQKQLTEGASWEGKAAGKWNS